MGKRSAWCNCEETKDEFGGCVPSETGKKCIACGKRIAKKTIVELKKHEEKVDEIFGENKQGKIKARKITWKKETTGSFGSQSLIGRVGKIKVFSIIWSVSIKEHRELPYVLQSYLIPLKKKRFRTEKQAKKYAIEGFCQIVSELVEN